MLETPPQFRENEAEFQAAFEIVAYTAMTISRFIGLTDECTPSSPDLSDEQNGPREGFTCPSSQAD